MLREDKQLMLHY